MTASHSQKKLPSLLSSQQHFAGIFASEPMTLPAIDHVSFLVEHAQTFFAGEGHTQLDNIAHEQTIICRQLFAGHEVGSRPMKRKKNLLRMKRCSMGNVEVAYSCTWEDC